MDQMNFAEIIINQRNGWNDALYTYEIPKELYDKICIGSRVMVPFGKGNKSIEGYVVDISSDVDIELDRIKEILSIVDDKPMLSEEMISLCKWMKEEYICSLIDVFQCVLPTGIHLKEERKYRLSPEIGKDDLNNIRLSDKQQVIIDALIEHETLTENMLKQILAQENIYSIIKALEKKKLIVLESTYKRSVNVVKEKIIKLSPQFVLKPETYKIGSNAKKQQEVLDFLLKNNEVEWTYLRDNLKVLSQTITALQQRGIIEIDTVEKKRIPYKDMENFTTQHSKLTKDQAKIMQAINPYINSNKHQTFLLHGVTGSGKTEVYMQLIDLLMKQSKEAIVLVPEISITSQMVERFKGRFGDHVAVLHSKLSLGERFDEWNRIKNGEVKVVVGARSAVFAPFQNLGIIVVDEEHEHTYKSEASPKYHAVEVAQYRCRQHNAVLLLGSATPSLESYYKALQGEYIKLEMLNRYNDNTLPSIEIVDMRKELEKGNKSVFSEQLFREIENNLQKKEQTILFLNRRGYSTFISCRSCGFVVKCPHCDISLNYHKNSHHVSCHYCGFTQQPPTTCPKCSSKYIKYFGVGTEKIEKLTQQYFPQARVARLDLDTTSQKGSMDRLISDFRKGNIDILIGTQMIAKGLDFPNVTLVGVIAADTSLNLPEFRANERTFQLITQVAGRAGRGERLGRVVVQTYIPDHFTIQTAQKHDFVAFFQQEILFREGFLYPPFSKMINIIISGEKEKDVIHVANKYASGVRHKLLACGMDERKILFGPNPAPMSKIKNQYRWQIIIKSKDVDQNILKGIISYIRLGIVDERHNIQVNVDINPYSML